MKIIMELRIFIRILLFVLFKKFTMAAPKSGSSCGGKETGLHGRITSPEYPRMYANSLNCEWTITVPKGYILTLTFTEFELEWSSKCSYDFVEVRAPNGTIGKYCGARPNTKSKQMGDVNKAPSLQPIKSYNNILQIFLSTDFSNEDNVRGFDAHFVAEDVNECLNKNGGCEHKCHNFYGGFYCSCNIGYKLRSDKRTCAVQCTHVFEHVEEGIITTPEYPNNYPHFAVCEWHIIAKKGYFVNLEFQDFDIEAHQDVRCPYDYLYIEDENKKTGPYCGKSKPEKLKSYSNWLIIEFFADHAKEFKGFKAKFWLEPIRCVELRPPLHGNFIGQPKFTVHEVIKYKCNYGYKLEGDNARKCILNEKTLQGHWNGFRPVCTRLYCPEPYNYLANGYGVDQVGGRYYVGSKVHMHCNSFFDLFGSRFVECKEDGTWSKYDSFCAQTCGRTSRRNYNMENCWRGTSRMPSETLFQPWLIAIFDKGELICSGFLISNQWALTSTHCIKDAEERYGRRGNLKVVLGAQNYKKYKDQFGVETRTIIKSVVRRRFDYGFHSDLTLIKLNSPVRLTKYIQPICLPELKRHKHYFRPEKVIVATGWGNPKYYGLKSPLERCEKVTKRSACKSYINSTHIDLHMRHHGTADGRRRLMPPELACTNSTHGVPDICRTMPGSGIISYDKQTRRWFLGGILSWGSLKHDVCEKFIKKYSIYTKVYKYINWITEHTKIKDLKYPDVNDPRIERIEGK